MLDADKTKIKEAVLGQGYELSLVFINNRKSRELNRKYRGKDKPTNVLAFPISKKSGEIFIDLVTVKKEAGDFGMTFQKFTKFLFIHALLHLKGMRHGSKMNRREFKLLSQFNGTSHRSGY